jgi:proteasome lid subunit RPN8/RPN11
MAGLQQRGNNYSRESGAFLLGRRSNGRTRITDFVLYDDLDPACLDTGIVSFNGRYFGALWDYCKTNSVSVVADVHTHPGGVGQSDSDRNHPMISRSGHIALIVPCFAKAPVKRSEVGIYRYEGAKQWRPVSPEKRSIFLHIGL